MSVSDLLKCMSVCSHVSVLECRRVPVGNVPTECCVPGAETFDAQRENHSSLGLAMV